MWGDVSMLRMELSECGMMQFMPAHFKIPLFAIERIGRVVVEPADGLDDWRLTIHWHGQADCLPPGDLAPPFVQARFVEEHDGQLLDFVFFDVAPMCCAAAC